jgi:uncharacterized protein (TIRG00374 family)
MKEAIQKNILVLKQTIALYKIQFLFLAKIIISIGLLLYLISFIEPSKIISAVINANIYLISLAVSFVILNVYLQYLKWKITCSSLLGEENSKKIILSLLYGFSAGAFTPVRVGEYFGRALVLKDKSFLQVTTATLIDKFFALVILVFFGSIASILFIYFYYKATFYITLSLFIVVFTLFYLLILLIRNPEFFNNLILKKLNESRRLSKLLNKLKILSNLNEIYSLKMISISTLFYSCYIIQYSFLVSAFSGNYNFINYLWAGNLMMFAKTLIPPVFVSDIGIREGASVLFLDKFGESASVAFNASVFLFLINVLLPAVLGLILLIKKNND